MARIWQVRQRQSDKRWDMTVSSDEEGWAHAVGYCAGWKEWTEEECARVLGSGMWPGVQHDQELRRRFQAKYHKHGHETPAEAEACWREYELDQELRFYEVTDTQKKCAICGEWTQGMGELGRELSQRWPLCKDHQARASVEGLIRQTNLPV